MALIAVGGFQHETNTFAPTKADYRAFEEGGGWPGAQFGADAAKARAAVVRLAGEVEDAEKDFALELFEPDDAVRRAMQRGESGAPGCGAACASARSGRRLRGREW